MPDHAWLSKDLYAVLDVPYGCTDDAVKRAYRRLARRHHPDANRGSRVAERRFVEINEAYTVLSDGALRHQYDRARHPRLRSSAASGGTSAPGASRASAGASAAATRTGGGGDPFGGWSAVWCSPAIWTTVVWTTMARSAARTPMWGWSPQQGPSRPGADGPTPTA